VLGLAQSDAPRIKIDDLKKMIDTGAGGVIIIDTQPLDVYQTGHIKGAVSLPWKKKISLQDVARLQKDKLIVTYCDCGPGESDSGDVASQLLEMGFKDVRVLQDPSIQGWIAAGYPVEK
jgi:rhodanese-related sulfurtransferase